MSYKNPNKLKKKKKLVKTVTLQRTVTTGKYSAKKPQSINKDEGPID